MSARFLFRFIGLLLLVLFLGSGPAKALSILANYPDNGFSDAEKAIIENALQRWRDLLPCNDGMQITIDFRRRALDPNVLGETGTNFNADGQVTDAKITLDDDSLSWSNGVPASGYDAQTVVEHEVAHALGFWDGPSIGGNGNDSAFTANIGSNATNGEFYDFNGNGLLDGNDVDLVDRNAADDIYSDHTLDGGLLDETIAEGTRLHATLAYAKMLGDSYGYCVAPEPITAVAMLTAVASLAGYTRRRQAARSGRQ